MQKRDRRGGGPFLRGRRSRGGGALATIAAGFCALVGDAVAAGGTAATTTTFKGEAQRSVVHRVPPPPAAGAAGRGEGDHHARAGRGEQT